MSDIADKWKADKSVIIVDIMQKVTIFDTVYKDNWCWPILKSSHTKDRD